MSKFPSQLWNKTIEPTVRQKALAGSNVYLSQGEQGTIIEIDERAGDWRHPWHTAVVWVRERQAWCGLPRAGFVNGQDPSIYDVPLLDIEGEEQWLKLELREHVGVPLPFFASLGVREPPKKLDNDGGQGSRIDDSWKARFTKQPPERKLWSGDIQLSVARLGLGGTVRVVDGSGESGQVVNYYPEVRNSILTSRGKRAGVLQAVKDYKANQTPDLFDLLSGVYEDPQEDLLHIARVWLLSPPVDEDFENKPDESWTPIVQHFVFWNLGHATRQLETPQASKPIRLGTGLLGGLADSIGNQMLSFINDNMQRIESAMQTKTAEGRFWTI